MGVLTVFYRVSSSMYDRIVDDPDIIDAIEEGDEDAAPSVDAVQKLAPLLAAIPLATVAKAAIDSEDFDMFRTKPGTADYAATALGVVVDFVREAAAAREAIVITTS